jgi:formate dehydrogenase subunit gamma
MAQSAGERPPQLGPGEIPGQSLGGTSDAEFWRMIRHGEQGSVANPDKKAGVLIQSQGEDWRNFRNGPVSRYGAWGMLGIVVALALFFTLRGRIKIEKGVAGVKIERFNFIERFGHWLTAVSFIVLALTGLNILYGRQVLLPILGKDAFSTMTMAGKYAHNYIAFAFMAGLVMIFIMWVAHNMPNRHDLKWLAVGGGLFTKGVHPPSKKFNAGQKLVFWLTILGGLSLSFSGWALLDPFQYSFFSDTFAILNVFGFSLPTELTLMQEQQLAQLWHSIVALFMIAAIAAHIYIGSVGMEGAFDAMGTGKVDLNWAKEHHNLWVEEVQKEESAKGGTAPAE